MSKRAKITSITVIGVCFVWASLSAQAAAISRTCRLPVLTVKDDAGSVVYVKMQYERDPSEDTPLSISISENLPQASGEQLRASIWQAAMVAAIERGDTLNGAEIRFTIPCQIDGPSAGAAFCLAIMSAMDGRQFPTNTAITGTVLPDGSIGRVGGLPFKIMAARDASLASVIVPDCLMREYDAVKDMSVDVKQLAKVLGLKFSTASSVSEAYAKLHCLAMPPWRSEDKIDIPDEIEAHYRRMYDLYSDKLSSLIKKNPNEFSPTNDESKVFADNAKALQAAGMGYYDVAYNYQRDALASGWAMISASQQVGNTEFMKSFAENVGSLLKRYQDPFAIAAVARHGGLSIGGLQYITAVDDGRMLGDYAQNVASICNKAKLNEEDTAIVIVQVLMVANLVDAYYSDFVTNALTVDAATVYPTGFRLAPKSGAENLFYSTYLASRATFNVEFDAECRDLGVAPDKVRNDIVVREPTASAAFSQFPIEGHDRLSAMQPKERDYYSFLLVQSHIGAISQYSRLLIRTELDPVQNADGSMTYLRSGLLHQLLRAARTRALDAVLNCRDRGLPWISAATLFRDADFSRDDRSVDQAEVLVKYWQVFLRANATMIYMVPDKSVQPSAKQLGAQGVRVLELRTDCQPALKALAPGDMICSLGGVRVRETGDLQAIVSAMPKGRKYEVRFTAVRDGKEHAVNVVGGQHLGVYLDDGMGSYE